MPANNVQKKYPIQNNYQMKEKIKWQIIHSLKWFATKHGILVGCMLLAAASSAVWYFTNNIDVNHAFYYIMWVFLTPPLLFLFISLFISIPVNMIRGQDTGRENWWFIKQWTKVQKWFNRPWTPYKKK